LSGGTPPRHGTHVLLARSVIFNSFHGTQNLRILQISEKMPIS